MALEAYRESFSYRSITITFRKAGMWPVRPSGLLSIVRLLSIENTKKLISVEQTEKFLVKKRRAARQRILGE